MDRQFSLSSSESIIFSLRSLYDSYGYSRYRMSKFEEYDLYSKNKDFLISDSVITFTDTNSHLMALKPDVTLSIVKNTKNSGKQVQKLYYNENVYRVSKSTKAFKEIMQVGLECLGNVDEYCLFEVISLAAKSLKAISENAILDISHLGIISETLDYIGVPAEEKNLIFSLIGEKNRHEIMTECKRIGISQENIELLQELVFLHGEPCETLIKAQKLLGSAVKEETFDEFKKIVLSLDRDIVRIDFSLVEDVRYYNGFVFKGFVEGIPTSVLSGGQYDILMKRMKREDKAVGFAVYLDMLGMLFKNSREYDVDFILLYNESDSTKEVNECAAELRKNGGVLCASQLPADIRYRKIYRIENGEVKEIENDA